VGLSCVDQCSLLLTRHCRAHTRPSVHLKRSADKLFFADQSLPFFTSSF